MEFLHNVGPNRLGDALASSIDEGAKLSIISVYFTGSAHKELKEELGKIDSARFLFSEPTFINTIEESDYYEQFCIDPTTCLSRVASKIKAAKNEVVTKEIKHTKPPESQWYTMDILAVDNLRAYLGQNAWKPVHHKSIYSYVIYDSSTVEQPYAVALDRAEMVKIFTKPPSKFKIDTPLGSYNPGWAYVEEVEGRERVFFVMETKDKVRGTNRPAEETKIDCAVKHFEALGLGPNFQYDVEVRYHYDYGKG